MFVPTEFGSGGRTTSGGAAFHLQVAGEVFLDGGIFADGEFGCGAGAGGSVWIETPAFHGYGQITANGIICLFIPHHANILPHQRWKCIRS